MIVSGRAGTLIAENVDVLVRGAYASDRVDDRRRAATRTPRSYVELGGGFEVRLRRTIGLGLSGLTRQTERYATVSERDSRHPEPDRSAAAPVTAPTSASAASPSSARRCGCRSVRAGCRRSSRSTAAARATRSSTATGSVDDRQRLRCSALDTGILDAGLPRRRTRHDRRVDRLAAAPVRELRAVEPHRPRSREIYRLQVPAPDDGGRVLMRALALARARSSAVGACRRCFARPRPASITSSTIATST